MLAGAVLLAAGALLWVGREWSVDRPAISEWLRGDEQPAERAEGVTPAAPGEAPAAEPDPLEPSPGPDAEATPRVPGHVAIVFDDLGRSLEEVAALRSLGVPLSYAVLPFERQTAEVTAALSGSGEEVLVHLPMMPSTDADPGPGALDSEMSARRLRRATRDALERVPGAVGASNHMGSELTADREAVRAVLEVVAERRLFFLDSRTSAESVAYPVARELGIPTAERDVFLDADPNREVIRAQFRALLERSTESGAAIGIAHPHEATIEVLAEELPAALAAGYTVVPVSFLLERRVGPGEEG